ncbi:MAG: Crp/Fnr family transcriptional regulator [Bacteroidota bacterium]
MTIQQLQIKQSWEKYKHLWKLTEAPARTLLLREGDICRKVFVIQQGCIRQWFNHDGKEISFQFFFEGDVVSSPDSFRKNTPSTFAIETIEPVVLSWIDRQDMEIIRQDEALYDYMINRAADKQAEFMQHFFSYLKDTPRQRYENLLRNKPEIVRRVPLQYIATYLGITQVSLSRIRKSLSH